MAILFAGSHGIAAATLINQFEQARDAMFAMHACDIAFGNFEFAARSGDVQRALAVAAQDFVLVADAGKGSLRHADDGMSSLQRIEEMFPQAGPAVVIKVDEAVDDDAVDVLLDQPQELEDAGKFPLIEFTGHILANAIDACGDGAHGAV